MITELLVSIERLHDVLFELMVVGNKVGGKCWDHSEICRLIYRGHEAGNKMRARTPQDGLCKKIGGDHNRLRRR
jgi:hypothetical protein